MPPLAGSWARWLLRYLPSCKTDLDPSQSLRSDTEFHCPVCRTAAIILCLFLCSYYCHLQLNENLSLSLSLVPGRYCFWSFLWTSFTNYTSQAQLCFTVPRSQPLQKDRTRFWTSWPPWEGHVSHWLPSSIPRRPSRNLGSPKVVVRSKCCVWEETWFLGLERSSLTVIF